MTTKMTDQEIRASKLMLAVMLMSEYLYYLKTHQPGATIYWNYGTLTPKEFEKVFNSVLDHQNEDKIFEMVKVVNSDTAFDEWFKKQGFLCRACGAYDLEEKKKLSSYHPEWQGWQEENEPGENDALEENERWIVFKQECLNCGHITYTSCGSETVEEAKNGIR